MALQEKTQNAMTGKRELRMTIRTSLCFKYRVEPNEIASPLRSYLHRQESVERGHNSNNSNNNIPTGHRPL